jgi:hypothetical protein
VPSVGQHIAHALSWMGVSVQFTDDVVALLKDLHFAGNNG